MNLLRLLNVLYVALLIAVSNVYAIEIEHELLDRFGRGESSGYAIFFREHADLLPAYEMNWNERGQYVVAALQDAAEKAQLPVREYLAASGVEFKSFWIDNVIVVEVSDRGTFEGLQQFAGIESLRTDPAMQLIEPLEASGDSVPATVAGRDQADPNIAHVRAPDVWALGIEGQGKIVGSIDTGVRYTHEALIAPYRGNLGGGVFDHNHNWWDSVSGTSAPVDTHGHGTFTLGTIVGNGGEENRIGMAPGAQWIACRAAAGAALSASNLLECAQFMAAPWDMNAEHADPDLRPHVVNNSWGDCSQSYNGFFQQAVDAWHAAGIVPVFANGNRQNCGYSAPPGCHTVGNPARYGNVLSVGSTGTDNGQYADHSNWGPTDNPWDENPLDFPTVKPNIVAPGVQIRSATIASDSAYMNGSGTSIAAPHVAGLVALLWQAAPCLEGNYVETAEILMASANGISYDSQCGGEGQGNVPNHATGWGEIDAAVAVSAAIERCPFSLSAAPEVIDICAGDTADYALGLLSYVEFDDEVTLSVTDGLPLGAVADIVPNPVLPENPATQSVLTISDTAGLATAGYDLEITAESFGSDHDPAVYSISARLLIDAAPLDAPTLLSPADGAGDVDLQPVFIWDAAADEDYHIQVAADAGFGTLVVDEVVKAVNFVPVGELAIDTDYFWRVRGHNACGDGEWSDTFSFATRLEPVAQIVPQALTFDVNLGDTDSEVLEIGNIGTGNLLWSIAVDTVTESSGDRTPDTALDESFNLPDFILVSPANNGMPLRFTRPGGVPTRGEVTGFTFTGTATGVSGSFSWASDTCMIIESPDGTIFGVGGNNGILDRCGNENAWDFQGAGSDEDSVYQSAHGSVFDPAVEDQGDWMVTFVNDWDTTSAADIAWTDVVVTLHKTPQPSFCDDLNEVDWLRVMPESGATPAGQTDTVELLIDSAGLTPGTYFAGLCMTTNDPDAQLTVVPITLVVSDPDAGTLTGTVTSAGHCGDSLAPLAGVPVTVEGQMNTFTTTTRHNGSVATFALKINAGEGPVTIAVDADNHYGDSTAGIVIEAGQVATADFVLVLDEPCVRAEPDYIDVTVEKGETVVLPVAIANVDGAAGLNWTIGTADIPGRTAARIVDCDKDPGLIIHDDGTIENAYTGLSENSDEVAFVDRFTPDIYPVLFESICIALATMGQTSLDFEVVAFDDDGPGGSPGTELGALPALATGIPGTLNAPVWQSYDISQLEIRLDFGSVYFGIRWATTDPSVFVAADQSANNSAGFAGGHRWDDSSDVWTALEDIFPEYRALFVRMVAAELTGCDDPNVIGWLDAGPASGSAPAGGSGEVELLIDTAELSRGQYYALLCIYSNDPVNPLLEVPVTLNVVEVAPVDDIFRDRFDGNAL